MARSPDGSWPVVWWAQARDCEALHGRAFAESTWGTGYYREDAPSPLKGEGLAGRMHARERAVNRLFALSALRQVEVAEAKAKKPTVIRPWKPTDGLAARQTNNPQ